MLAFGSLAVSGLGWVGIPWHGMAACNWVGMCLRVQPGAGLGVQHAALRCTRARCAAPGPGHDTLRCAALCRWRCTSW